MKNRALKRTGWLGLYTLFFLCVAAALGLVMLVAGRTLVWDPDGVKQHYTVIGLVGRAARDLLAGRGLSMMNFSLGQGMDLLTTCGYYGYTDPLSLLGALFAERGIEWAYILSDFLRLYLAGVFFGLYARRVGSWDGWATACASAVYISCGYFAWMLGRHPYFINGGLYLPLLLLGVERVLGGRRWLLYVLAVGLMLWVNFYFAYMNTAFAILYILVRLGFRLRTRGVKDSAVDGLMLLGGYLLGAALAAAVFLPIAMVYLANSRLGVRAGYSGSMFHYPKGWYRDLAAALFAPWLSPGNYLFVNLAPLALFGLLAQLGRRDVRARQMRVGLALALVAACVPAAGLALNGGAYVSNRWSYGIALFAALCCAMGLPELFRRESRCRKPVAVAALAMAALLAVDSALRRQWRQLVVPACIALFAALLLVYEGGRLTRKRAKRWASAFLAVTCALYVAMVYAPRLGYGYIRSQERFGILDRVSQEAGATTISDDGVYRVSQGFHDDAQAPLLGYMGTSYYWSLVDGENSRYYTDLGLPTQGTTYHLFGLGGSAAMNAVAAVKYFAQMPGEDYVVPSGYEPAPAGGKVQIYENPLALPLGYAYDETLSKSDYDALPVEDRLQAITRYAIVADEQAQTLGSVPEEHPGSDVTPLEFTAAAGEGADFSEGRMGGEKGGRIALAFQSPEDSETYLIFEGLAIESLAVQDDGSLTVESSAGRARAIVPHPDSNFYFEKPLFAICVGSGALEGCDIVFGNGMEYRFDAMRVVSLPMAGYREAVEARRSEAMTDVALGRDSLSGRISVGGDRVVQIAVPYSPGWRAWVDGAEQPVFRCGGMYMGLALPAGEHQIELRYATPGLKPGVAISAGAALLTLALAVVSAVRRRRERKDA